MELVKLVREATIMREKVVRESIQEVVRQATVPVAIQTIMELEVMGAAGKVTMVVAVKALLDMGQNLVMEPIQAGRQRLVERLSLRLELQGAEAITRATRNCKGQIPWATGSPTFCFPSCLIL